MSRIPNLEEEAIDVRTLYPDPEKFSVGRESSREEKRTQVETALNGNAVIVVADDDLDGYGCATLLAAFNGPEDVGVIHAGHSDPPGVEAVLTMLGEAVGPNQEQIYICDLPPNEESAYVDAVKQLQKTAFVTVYDHHNWSDGVRSQIGYQGEIVIGSGISGTEVTHKELSEDWHEASSWNRFVTLVTDHDLGSKKIDRSETLADSADQLSAETFRRKALEQKEQLVEDATVTEIVEEYRTTKQEQIRLAKQRAQVDDSRDVTVITTYGRCPSSQTAHHLLEAFDGEVVVLFQPNGEMNIRTADSHPVSFEIADQFGGGGREYAAGATPNWFGDDAEQIFWTDHWATMGEEARNRTIAVVRSVL